MAEPEDMTLEELLQESKTALAGSGGSKARRVEIAIQVRLAEKQEKSARDLVDATDGLGTTTSRLVWATWGLVAATFLLVVAEVVSRYGGRLLKLLGLSFPH